VFPTKEKWARAFVMTGITIASADIDEVITAAAEAQRLFRDVGDRIWKANSLFIAGWRAIDGQILTETVGGWLSQSLELGRQAGDNHAIAHAELSLARCITATGILIGPSDSSRPATPHFAGWATSAVWGGPCTCAEGRSFRKETMWRLNDCSATA
jgi:hypothetical protein